MNNNTYNKTKHQVPIAVFWVSLVDVLRIHQWTMIQNCSKWEKNVLTNTRKKKNWSIRNCRIKTLELKMFLTKHFSTVRKSMYLWVKFVKVTNTSNQLVISQYQGKYINKRTIKCGCLSTFPLYYREFLPTNILSRSRSVAFSCNWLAVYKCFTSCFLNQAQREWN